MDDYYFTIGETCDDEEYLWVCDKCILQDDCRVPNSIQHCDECFRSHGECISSRCACIHDVFADCFCDNGVEEMVESGRREYYDAWWEYISEYSDE